MIAEFIVDKTWYGKRYSLSDIFIPIHDVHTDSEWLCVMNRNRDDYYILPMSVVKSAQIVYNERGFFYAIDARIID